MGSCLSSDGRGGGAGPASLGTPASAKRYRKGGSRRRQGPPRSSSHESRREEQLHRIPGRLFLNGASGVASLFTQQGKKGTNQDAMIVWENFGSRADTVFCGVFDGHGPYGHMVARRVRDSLPLKLSSHLEVNIGSEDYCIGNSLSTHGSMNSEGSASMCLDEDGRVSTDIEESEKQADSYTMLKELFLKAFKVMDKELRFHPNIDCFCSGTTAVTLVKKGQDLVIGNVGDSRAILGTRDHNDCLIAVQLTVDLKPNLPREAERIRRCKGRVFALQDEPEVARVWLPNNDSPGLAMARAFGDFCLKDFGLISVPEVSYRRLSDRDEFVVLATDGIWDVLSNKEVVDIVASAPARSSAARSLVETAVRAWRLKYPTSKIDDCAVVCLFLDSDSFSYSSNNKTKEEDASLADGKQDPSTPTAVNCCGTIQSSSEIFSDAGKEAPKQLTRSQSHQEHSGADASPEQGDEWSALEGVSRVNTLLTLPRYVAGVKRSGDTKGKK